MTNIQLKFKKTVKFNAFTMTEMFIALISISIAAASSLPLITQLTSQKSGLDKNTMNCVVLNDSTGWYDTDGIGSTVLPSASTSPKCNAAVLDVQYDRGTAFYSTTWYAQQGTTAQKSMAKKILRAACDKGGSRACDFFINSCRQDGSASIPYCDDQTSFSDLTYYLHLHKNSTANIGGTYIYNQLITLLPKMVTNLLNETFYDVNHLQYNNNTQTSDTSQNLNVNFAYLLAQPSVFIKACNKGVSAGCTLAHDYNYNKSCQQIKAAWDDAPTGNYKLTYNGAGSPITTTCNMYNRASAAITGCTSIVPADNATFNCSKILGAGDEATSCSDDCYYD